MTTRNERVEEKRFVKSSNNCGKRISWARKKLGLLQKEVALEANIPLSTYCGREAGVRTGIYEEYFLICSVLDKHWSNKYKNRDHPSFQGVKVPAITIAWIMFGRDTMADNLQRTIEELREAARVQAQESARKELELHGQINLFSDALLKMESRIINAEKEKGA